MSEPSEILARETTDLLLVSKSIIDRVRAQRTSNPDRFSLAINILLAHDAAELTIAAIASHLDKLPTGDKRYLMDYFSSIKTLHPEKEVAGKSYFDQLNRVRVNLKHKGIFPDPQQWGGVGDRVYEYLQQWCFQYLELSLDDLDESVLIRDPEVKRYYEEARANFAMQKYKDVMEKLAWALHAIFEKKAALHGLAVGVPNAENAIRLAAFGVQANDFLRLQQFLPRILVQFQGPPKIRWSQSEYGHPGNWHAETARFCLRTFLDLALKLQMVSWIPGPIHFSLVYECKIEIIKDTAEVWNLPEDKPYDYNLNGDIINRELIKKLSKGTVLRGSAWTENKEGLLGLLVEKKPKKDEIFITCDDPEKISGYVAKDAVKIICSPRTHEFIKENFPDLPEIEWEESK